MSVGTTHGILPELRPEGIAWRSVGPFVEVQLLLTNASSEATEEAELVIEAAPFGAFVPFEPVTRLSVASFEPYESRRITTKIPAGQLAFASGFPRRVTTTADGAVDDADLRSVLEAMRSARWAGNLNVWFDRAPEEGVELHRALDMKVMANEKVWFLFCLGAEDYDMEASGSDPAWSVEVGNLRPLGGLLVVTPPPNPGVRASVEVRVTRTSDGRTVPVLFGMETVQGEGDSLGCLQG